MTNNSENVEDGTEGGYTAYPADHPQALQDYFRRLATKLGAECPNPDCICKNDAEPEYITTDRTMAEDLDAAYYEALAERYGEVTSTHSEDLEDFGFEDTEPEFEFLLDPDDID